MPIRDSWTRFRAEIRSGTPHPDVSRAVRDTIAVMVPLVLAGAGWMPLNTAFVAFAAQSVAIQDVRGPYTLRLAVLLAMTAILAGAAELGELASPSVTWSVVGAGAVAVLGGCWRHFLPEYGTSLAISSTLLFVLSVNLPPAASPLDHHGLGALVGGFWAVLLQVVNWPIRPQHPLRRAVADSWTAIGDLFETLASGAGATRRRRLDEREAALRATLDHAYAALATPAGRPPDAIRSRLGDLNLTAARLATRVVALETVLEPVLVDPKSGWLADALQPLLTALTNTARSVAVTIVSRQPAHLASCEVRLDRLANLLELFQSDTGPRPDDDAAAASWRELLRQLARYIPETRELLRAIVDPAGERAAFSLELFDLHTWTLRPLASTLVLDRRVDRVLVRFTARVTVLTMAGVAVFKLGGLSHGYWLPLTMVIIMQPDYGATRLRAGQRALGTFAGSVIASALLWLQLGPVLIGLATAATIFGFAYFLKRSYTRAVFFVTLMVVLLTEAHAPVTLAFTAERLGSTLVGAALALLGSLYFWPVWERERVPQILATAIEGNREYLRLIAERFTRDGSYDMPLIVAKRRVEAANAAVFQSLQRLRADPERRQTRLQQAAALANGNQRITRALVVVALQLDSADRPQVAELAEFAATADAMLDDAAAALRTGTDASRLDRDGGKLRDLIRRSEASGDVALRDRVVAGQLARIATELGAIRLALRHGFLERSDV